MNRIAVLCLSLASVVVVSIGCSAFGLDRIQLHRCTMDSDCQALNLRFGIGRDECARFQCAEDTGVCEHRERRDDDEDHDPSIACGGGDCDDTTQLRSTDPEHGIEICDGIDNDCDETVDEALLPEHTATLATGFTGTNGVAYATTEADGTVALGALGTATAPFSTLGDGSGAASTAVSVGFRHDAFTTVSWYNDANLTDGCAGAGCTYAEVATAAVGDRRLIAVVGGATCAAGAVRIGYAEAEAMPATVLRGPLARSNIYAGFDLDPLDCNGASRTGGAHGAARPAIAGIDDATTPLGLAAWIGDARSRARCGGSDAPVEALVVWLESDRGATWTNASNDAVPAVLGTTSGGGAPAILALDDASGFVVAFGTSGGIALRFVPRLASPALPGTGSPDVARPTSPLTMMAAQTIATTAAPDHVSLAVGRTIGGAVELGLAWVESCGTGDEQTWFSTVRWSGGAFTSGTPMRLSTTRVEGAPTLRHVGSPLVAAGRMRNGAVADDTSDSGWLVAWPQTQDGQSAVFARHVLDLDGAPLETAPYQLVGADALPRDLALVPAASATSTMLLAFSTGGDAIVGAQLCSP